MAALNPQPAPAAARPNPQTPALSQTFRDCAACPLMVRIPAGEFHMGAAPNDRGARPYERPQHRRHVAAFAAAAFETTFAEYDACAAAGGCADHPRPSDNAHGRGNRPAINISWRDANAYIDWLNAQTGGGYRLLSEAEWEYAARAGSTDPYPWGRFWTRARTPFQPGNSAVIPAKRRNAFGVGAMIGGVAEWVAECWSDSYAATADLADNRAPYLGLCAGDRVIRGGSWRSRPRDLRSAARSHGAPETRRVDLGFRVAKTVAE